MVHLSMLPEGSRNNLQTLEVQSFDHKPWVEGKPLAERTIAIVSSAGLMRRGAPPFRGGDHHYTVIAQSLPAADLMMSHISVNFDRTGFQQDANVMLPRDRLAELAADGVIGAVADHHYSFMGATDPLQMETDARELAGRLKAAGVDSVLGIPV